ncbi:hypothetical protein [Spartinivicinus poritis]|uniref:N-acetyltransferase domain-containing protein n=1 Tax=Spartinivicinus poritis TaxID=2994640 RepID=A0ABT5UGT7_9GAMM|nr:hypothetical protein [Spartinivicinus sp. A2-2]MDE1465591.1 hypothetical protein [Spartinivicinus sp. A2-2]
MLSGNRINDEGISSGKQDVSTKGKRKAKLLKDARIPIEEINDSHVREMWEIFRRFYDEVNFNKFFSDLKNKQGVIVALDHNEKIRGFSTYKFFNISFENATTSVIFTGDTILEPQFWGQSALKVGYTKLVMYQKLKKPSQDLYWFLISKGYKTYLAMTRNFPNCWPKYNVKTPPKIAQLLNESAIMLYPSNWRKEKGLLEFKISEGQLKSHVARIELSDELDPDIKFFMKKNPNHINGDELCCLAKIDWKYFYYQATKSSRKLFKNIIK